MSQLIRDAAIVTLAQAAKQGNWSFQTFKETYGKNQEDQEYIESLLDGFGFLEYYDSYYVGSKFVAVYEWRS